MLDLRPDGTMGLTFTRPDSTVQKVTVHPPKVGAYRRLRKELYSIDTARAAYEQNLPEGTSDTEARNLTVEFHEDGLLAWWRLVLLGDDTFAKLTDDEVPADQESWPLELATNAAAITALGHWVSAPFSSMSAQPPPTNEP